MKRSNPNSALAVEPLLRPGIVANIPNALSVFRLLSAPVLLALAIGAQGRAFRWLLVFSLLSDILDGLIARALRITSKIGALLDSTADILVSAISVFGVFKFQSQFVAEHYNPILVVIALYLLSTAGGVLRYGRLASFHTISCRVAAYAQGIFVVLLLFRGYEPTLFYLMIGLSALAYIEEITLVWLLPTWSANVGGLYWVLRK
jgi:CDP-diacylglycerol--glycerol-3-phosphate 3-phosphatidyltransferase